MTPNSDERVAVSAQLDDAWFNTERVTLWESRQADVQPAYSRGPVPYTAVPFEARAVLNRLRIRVLGLRQPRSDAAAGATDTSLDEERAALWTRAAGEIGASADLSHSRDLVLTHDLDEAMGWPGVAKIRDAEREVGARSAFGVLSRRYQLDGSQLAEIIEQGCEIFSHGYLHDGTDPYLPLEEIGRRLEHFFETYPSLVGVTKGFRSGQLARSERLYDAVAKVFDFDLTPPGLEIGGPHGWRSGCRSAHPFVRPSGLVHIPLSLPQDYFLAFIDRLDPAEITEAWLAATRQVWGVGGIAVHLVHPDNVVRRPALLRAYRDYLEAVVELGANFMLPGEVAARTSGRLVLTT